MHTHICIGEDIAKHGRRVSTTWYYDFHEAKSWTKGPELLEARTGFVCGFLLDSGDPKIQFTLVAGGKTKKSGFKRGSDTTELLYVGSTTWIPGQPIQDSERRLEASYVTTKDKKTLLVIGGKYGLYNEKYAKRINSVSCFHKKCKWTTLEQQVRFGALNPTPLIIPDSLASCS